MTPNADHIQRFALAVTVAIVFFGIAPPASGAPADPEAAQRSPATLFRNALIRSASSSTPRRVTLLARPPWVDDTPHAPPHRNWPFAADPRRWPHLFANTTESTLSFDPILRRHRWQ